MEGRTTRHREDDVMPPRANVIPPQPVANRLHVDDIVRRDFISSALALTVMFVRREDVLGLEAGKAPVTFEHKFGSTTIDAEPTRVVTFSATAKHTVLALGRVPVGLIGW